ncbi:hypothetical protein Pyn_33631 [Prunus yedoensis var. nudiflora]|uniref:Uncharacterized protein n=1 Tax=Prunus yedoensis var. nudiflora TaxID=2094558 RepID=A0A314YRG2_PRUYE|nr:hypothetical protein Pyn_33631 [Prunus yedoensis var. nudiflora]
MLALGGRIIDEMSDVDLSTSAPENCQLVITDCGNEKPEQLHLPNSCYVGEQNQKELVPAEVNQKFPEPFSLIPHGMLDFSSNVAEILESQNVDDAVSENNETAVESYSLDSQSRNDFQLHCQDCSLKLDSVGDFMSKLNVKVQVEGGSAIKDIIEPKDFGTKDCNSPVESCSGVPQLQTEDDKSYCQQDT